MNDGLRQPESPPAQTRGKGRGLARKITVTLKLLRGEDLEAISRRYSVTAEPLTYRRETFLQGGEGGMKIRPVDLVQLAFNSTHYLSLPSTCYFY